MNKTKISILLALASVGTVAAVITSSVFVSQEIALTKDIKTLKDKRETIAQLKDQQPKHSNEIDKLLKNNPLVTQLAHENFVGVRTKIHNLQIAIDQLKRTPKSTLDKTNYNKLASQVSEFLSQISNSKNYKDIYESLKNTKDSTDDVVNKDSVTQSEINLETDKLQDAFNNAKVHKTLEDKISIASDFNSQLEQSKYKSVKEQLQEILDKVKAINNDKNSSSELLNKTAKDLQDVLDNVKNQKDNLDNNVISSTKYPEYKQALKEAIEFKNDLSNIKEYSQIKDFLDAEIKNATKDSEAKEINSQTSDKDLIIAIDKLKQAVSEASKQALNTATNLAKNYLNDFSDSKYLSLTKQVQKLLDKYNKDINLKTNTELKTQADEIINAIKSGRTKAEQKYDEILMFTKFFLADLTDNKKTQTKYVDIINDLKDSVNTQNVIRNDSSKSARDILEAKDKLLEALNKAILDKKILDAGDEAQSKLTKIQEFKKAELAYDELIKEVNDKLSDEKYAPLLEAFNKANKLNHDKRNTKNDDIVAWTKTIKQATIEAQKIADKVNEVLPEFDKLDARHKENENDYFTVYPRVHGYVRTEDGKIVETEDMYEFARDGLMIANAASAWNQFDILDISKYDWANNQFDIYYKESFISKQLADLVKVYKQALDYADANLSGEDRDNFKNWVSELFIKGKSGLDLEKLKEAVKNIQNAIDK